jgi:hypothetical protein
MRLQSPVAMLLGVDGGQCKPCETLRMRLAILILEWGCS